MGGTRGPASSSELSTPGAAAAGVGSPAVAGAHAEPLSAPHPLMPQQLLPLLLLLLLCCLLTTNQCRVTCDPCEDNNFKRKFCAMAAYMQPLPPPSASPSVA